MRYSAILEYVLLGQSVRLRHNYWLGEKLGVTIPMYNNETKPETKRRYSQDQVQNGQGKGLRSKPRSGSRFKRSQDDLLGIQFFNKKKISH